MDAYTRHRVNNFAINAQFLNSKNDTIIKTIAGRDTKSQHASDFLLELLNNVLEKIKKEQVLAIVTDNASNMETTIGKINKEETSVFEEK